MSRMTRMTRDELQARLRSATDRLRTHGAASLEWAGRQAAQLPRWVLITGSASLVVIVALLVFASGTGYQYEPVTFTAAPAGHAESETAPSLADEQSRERRLRRRLDRLAPRQAFIVVDQTRNRLYLRKGDEVVLEATCSAGSGGVLKEEGTDRQWTFDTPRGRYHVRGKIRNPVWRKPDWAFVETGDPIPSNPDLRLETGTLGEYALDLGDGYLIHGTLYERLLGRSVTHGCVRLGREDLRQVYRVAKVGTPVFIF